ncbi:MAG TPA: FliH/SctL family protein [Acidimicrobiales bacterium]|nr:FliH/SctL family protein [Acidimicrobiales bacterium]
MTISSDPLSPVPSGPTTSLPGFIDMTGVLPELTTPQERYDHGFRRGYMAGYAEGARQAQAERAADLAAHKAAWASAQAHAGALVSQLASAVDEYKARYGQRDLTLTTSLLDAAFRVAEAIVGHEVATNPAGLVQRVADLLGQLPAGPAVVRVNPQDKQFMTDAISLLHAPPASLEVVADPSVGPGGCVATSGATLVEARVEVSLELARRAFMAGDATVEPGAPQL